MVSPPSFATKLPAELGGAAILEVHDAHVRIDGSIQTKTGDIYLPVMPPPNAPLKQLAETFSKSTPEGKQLFANGWCLPVLPAAPMPATKSSIKLLAMFAPTGKPDLLLFSNGWCYLRVFKKGLVSTVVLPSALPEKLRKHLIACKLPSDLIVPDNVIFPRSLKPIIGELAIPTTEDSTASRADFGKVPPKPSAPHVEHGALVVTSPSTGNITLIDASTMNKVTDFPTEGTPTGMTWCNDRLYIADQSKSRVLILDPKKKQFLGQIDLQQRCAPKGIASLPNGQLIYVSETASNNVAVIETATSKVLMRTKVPAGPARIALTPNGNYLLVLNVPACEVTVLSTANQRMLGAIPVGSMPNAIAISHDSSRAYISNRLSNTISVIDISTRRVVETIPTGTGPTGIALSKDGTQLYVANAKANPPAIEMIDLKTKKQVQEVKLPIDIDFPGGLALMPDGKRLIVSSESTENVGILNIAKLEFDSQPAIGHNSDEIIWVPVDL